MYSYKAQSVCVAQVGSALLSKTVFSGGNTKTFFYGCYRKFEKLWVTHLCGKNILKPCLLLGELNLIFQNYKAQQKIISNLSFILYENTLEESKRKQSLLELRGEKWNLMSLDINQA